MKYSNFLIFVIVFLEINFIAVVARPAKTENNQVSTFSKVELWSIQYLYNIAIIYDYRSLLETQKGQESKEDLDEWHHFYWAINNAKSLGQYIKKMKAERKQLKDFVNKTKGTKKNSIPNSLPAAKFIEKIQNLSHSTPLECKISFEYISEFAQNQQSNLDNLYHLHPKNFENFKKLTNSQKICFLVALMGSSEGAKQKGYDPIVLMKKLKSYQAPIAKELYFKSLFAVRLIELGEYSKSLRLLSELSKDEIHKDWAKSIYQIVQKIYVRKQKGEGKVALGGI